MIRKQNLREAIAFDANGELMPASRMANDARERLCIEQLVRKHHAVTGERIEQFAHSDRAHRGKRVLNAGEHTCAAGLSANLDEGVCRRIATGGAQQFRAGGGGELTED